MKMAFSPCPNDTFIYHAWVHGLIPGAPKLDVVYADINITNEIATKTNDFDLMKISFAALPYISSEYALLPCGGALGKGCGPLLLTANETYDANTLIGKKIAVPSDKSTAYLLFRLWVAQNLPDGIGEIVVMPFDTIMPAVQNGEMDAGLVIHEARFTYNQYGLHQMIDLGAWWESDTGLPIPLGAIIAKRSLDLSSITKWIQDSVTYAWKNPEASMQYVLQHAQEMSIGVVKDHINLYVNNYSYNIGEDGFSAIKTLLDRAANQGLVPKVESLF